MTAVAALTPFITIIAVLMIAVSTNSFGLGSISSNTTMITYKEAPKTQLSLSKL
jgi:hypothetical protein